MRKLRFQKFLLLVLFTRKKKKRKHLPGLELEHGSPAFHAGILLRHKYSPSAEYLLRHKYSPSVEFLSDLPDPIYVHVIMEEFSELWNNFI